MKRLVAPLTIVLSLVLAVALFAGGCGCSCADELQSQGTTTTDGALLEATGPTDGTQSTSTSGATSTTLPPAATSTTLPPAATTSSTSPFVTLEPQIIPIPLTLPTRYEDDDPALQWVGSWTVMSSGLHSGGTAKATNTLNSRVGILFEGTGVRLIAHTPTVAGRIIVHLYGGTVDVTETIDLTGSGETKAVVWESGTIPDGSYQCWFTYDPTNTPGRSVWVDAVDIWPPTPPAP